MIDEVRILECYMLKKKEDVIEELKFRIQENQYEVKPDNIAERILWFGAHIIRMNKQIK